MATLDLGFCFFCILTSGLEPFDPKRTVPGKICKFWLTSLNLDVFCWKKSMNYTSIALHVCKILASNPNVSRSVSFGGKNVEVSLVSSRWDLFELIKNEHFLCFKRSWRSAANECQPQKRILQVEKYLYIQSPPVLPKLTLVLNIYNWYRLIVKSWWIKLI